MRIALALAIFAAASPALADATEARFFDELGRSAFARGRYDEALSHFLAAQEAAPSVRTLYNLALCAESARRPAAAFGWYEEYLAGADEDAVRRADAERRMERLRRTLALVRVTTEPSGATVYVDRRELGEFGRSPRTLVLTPGDHVIEIALEGHETVRVNVTAATGEVRPATAALRALTGTIHVDANAAGTIAVERDGAEIARGTIGGDLIVPVGAYRVRVEAPGHEPLVLAIAVREGSREQRRVTIVPLPQPRGRLLVASGDVHARVIVDGAPRAEAPASLELAAGDHEVVLEADGYVRWAGQVHVASGEAEYLDVTLIPAR